MLLFENKEEIDLRGITTFGTSVKTHNNAIGHFGTGLKYAIAVCLRLGFKIDIWSGTTKYIFYTKDIKIRNGDFKLICMREDTDTSPEVELSFTTELGKGWKDWQAYRELYCNAQDEGGSTEQIDSVDDQDLSFEVGTEITIDGTKHFGEEGKTKIFVWGMDDVHAQSDLFILRTPPKHELSQLDLHEIPVGQKGAIFYRGVRVYEPQQPLLFNYNFKSWVQLSEDRTLMNIYIFHFALMRSLISAQVPDVIAEVLTCPEGYFEHKLSFNDIEGEEPGQIFVGVMGTLERAKVKNASAYKYYTSYALDNLSHLPRSPFTSAQNRKLGSAKKLIRPCGYRDIYAVVLTDMLEGATLSKAGNNTIFLNVKVFDKSPKDIAEILMDNFSQLRHQANSRSWLINQLILLGNKPKKEKKSNDQRDAA